jgi:hypothetical protein
MATFRPSPSGGNGPAPSSWLRVATSRPKWLPHFCKLATPASDTSKLVDLHFASQQTRCEAKVYRQASTKYRTLSGMCSIFPEIVPTRLSDATREGGLGTRHDAVRTHDLPCCSCLRQPTSLSIVCLHLGPNRLIAQIVRLLDNAQSPKIVKSHPFPIAFMIGAATMAPTHEKMFRTKLLTATPFDDCLGINSVSIVVAMAKISIDPIP